ncbi:MAG: acyl-CoA dehydrogenase [Chloroflexota bacterium]|nr:acyl-CoA dehydrogenase [Chloroflexota bacterium]
MTEDGVGSDARPDPVADADADAGRRRIPSPDGGVEHAVRDGADGSGGAGPVDARGIAEAAHRVDGRPDRALALAVEVGQWLPAPGSGRIADRWRALTALGVGDLTAARVVEAHTDALAIVAEAESDAAGDRSLADLLAPAVDRRSTWGVFAAEGPGVRVDARPAGGSWLLTGTKPWCSLAGRLSHALVTAHTGSGTRRLFALDLRHPAVRVLEAGWVARGLTEVVSGPIELFDCPAVPVGSDGWYLQRPGFAWGGMGVAACWYGGAVGLARTLREAYRTGEPDQIAMMHLGAVDAVLTGARAVLGQAAVAIDHGRGRGADGALWASRVRAVVARAAEEVVQRVGHALGPAPLVSDERHARRVADLQLYLRQDHAERDDAALGRRVLGLTDWLG